MGQPPLGKSRVVTLPSGYKVRARRPSVFALVASGGFPAELTAMVWKLFQRKVALEDLGDRPDQMKQYVEVVEQFFPHVLADIKLGDETSLVEDKQGVLTGQINTHDFGDFDKQWLFLFGLGLFKADDEEVGVIDLSSFREEPTRADARSHREPVRAEAVSDRGAESG